MRVSGVYRGSAADKAHLGHFGGSRCDGFLKWHGILFEEPNPTGNRPRDLIGLYKEQIKFRGRPERPAAVPVHCIFFFARNVSRRVEKHPKFL